MRLEARLSRTVCANTMDNGSNCIVIEVNLVDIFETHCILHIHTRSRPSSNCMDVVAGDIRSHRTLSSPFAEVACCNTSGTNNNLNTFHTRAHTHSIQSKYSIQREFKKSLLKSFADYSSTLS